MKIFTKKGILQKTILVILTVLCINFIVPTYSHAGAGDFLYNVGGVLANALIDLGSMLGDAFASGMQWFMTGQFAAGDKFRDSAIMVEQGDNRVKPANGETTMEVNADDLEKGLMTPGDTYQVPVIEYTPEEIFSNKVPYLDINFINPKLTKQTSEYKVDGTAAILQETISGWYIALRNLAIVGLLCVLVYVGIRIIISSTAADKAKHKQMFMDWLIALCLLFFLHYIMSFTLVLIDSVNDALAGNGYTSETVNVSVSDGTSFSTNVMGATRFMIQSKDNMESAMYLAVYIALIVYTGIFTYHYLKRVLTMAFLTIIAPLVALTYPIDKIGDGKAQAFNMWLKEYVYTALIQPFHFIIYMIFIGSAMELVQTNFIFALASVAFILYAEKLLKKMFGFDKAPLGAMGALAGYTAGSLLGKSKGKGGSRPSGPSNGGNSSSNENERPKFQKTHGTDGIDYSKNSNLDSSASGAGLPSGENNNENEESNENKDATQKASETFAEQERQRQLEEQQKQLEGQQDNIREQELEQDGQDKKEEQQQNEQQSAFKSEQQSQELGKSKEKQSGRFRQGVRNVVNSKGGAKGIALKGARTLGRGAKFIARKGFETAVGATGAFVGAAVGLASGKGLAGVVAGAAVGNSLGKRVADTAENVGSAAIGVGKKAISGGRDMIDTFNGNTAMNDKHKAKIFMKDSSTDQYIRDKLAKDKGRAPTAQELRTEKQAIQTYADEGMTDIAQIYRARKTEDFVGASQSAKIALLAQDRKIDSKVLGDEKQYKQRKEDFTQEFMNKGFSEEEAGKQADYVLNVMKAQVGQRYNLPKSGKAPRNVVKPETSNRTTKGTSANKTPKTLNAETNHSGATTPRANAGANTQGLNSPKTTNKPGPKGSRAPKSTNPALKGPRTNTSGTNTPRTTNKPGPKGPRKK